MGGWAAGGGGDGVRTGLHNSLLLEELNADRTLDASNLLNSYIADDENISQFFQTHIHSDYFDADSFIAKFKNSVEPIMLSINIQSLNSKYNALSAFVRNVVDAGTPIDLIILQETWELRFPTHFIIPGFQGLAFRTRDRGRGGGVGIYVREGLNFKERPDLENYKLKTFENLVLEIQYPNKSYIVSNIYRSPNPPSNCTIGEHLESFVETLECHLARLSDCNCHTYVFLDANINLLHLNDAPICTAYLDTCITNGFLQLISKATRIQNNRNSLIDHILTNSNLASYNAGTIIDDISDHFMNFVQLGHIKNNCKKHSINSNMRIVNNSNIANLKLALNNTDWTPIYSDNDVDSSFNKFWDIFNNLYNEHLPITHVKFNKNKHRINGYMSQELLDARATKLYLHKIAIKNKTDLDLDRYRDYRNYYNTLIRQAKQNYYLENLNRNVKNPKRSWELLKEAANLNKSKSSIDKIDKDGQILTDPLDIANEFNDFFTSVGVKIAESIEPTSVKPEEFMPLLDNIQNLDLGTTSQVHICDIIKSLKTKNSCDTDGLSTKLLQKLATEISWPLAHIFRLSLNSGVFPARLKCSRTVPIFKAGRADLCDNYRPISLLSTLSKILEKMVCVQLVNHLDRNKILYKHQYGFQRNRSTEQSIVHAVNFISNAMNENKFTIGVFFDLKKAFDVCSHDILLMKLSKMGINGTALDWFKSYLSDRTQVVDINGNTSRTRKLKISVLQGSVLGPILFLCFINDLHSVTELLTLMFADDTFSLQSGDDLDELSNIINTEINKMAVWFRANRLAVNINKTKYMIFHMKGKKIPNPPTIYYNGNEPNQTHSDALISTLERYHDNHPQPECRSYKLLGIFLDEHLSLDYHVTHICNKLTRSLYCIKQAKHLIPLEGLKSLYFALIHSHLNYCTLIFSGITASNRQRIEKVQKKAIRIMTNSTYNAHTKPLFIQHAILPFDKLILQSQLNFMHAIEYKYAPPSFNDIWQKNRDRDPDVNLRNADDYYLTRPRTETFKKSTFYAIPTAWNDLIPEIKYQENKYTFKWALKAHLLSEIDDS
jgi:hypothetical protein